MKYDAIIVGGGVAGLTAAAYLCKAGRQVLLCEKEDHVGGLISSFRKDGFLYDAGARGIVDSGIVRPMLKQLGIDIDFVKSYVTIGIEDQMVRVETVESLKDYRAMLVHLYPENEDDIDRILTEIRKVMDYMDILYGIENPLFLDMKADREYLVKTLLPWLFRYIVKSGKIKRFQTPVDEFLGRLTDNPSLIDIISQHFFQKTPASFALSYFSLYLDYEYPVQGTAELVHQLEQYVLRNHGTIATGTKVVAVDPTAKTMRDQNGRQYGYDRMIWAADTHQLYQAIAADAITNPTIRKRVEAKRRALVGKRGGDSIYSLFVAVDRNRAYFEERASGHCFYTPNRRGQSPVFHRLDAIRGSTDKAAILAWMDELLTYTTYEIAIPSLRNEALAPAGKTGLVVSFLMDYDVIRQVQSLGFYEEFKARVEDKMIDVLDHSLYSGIKDKVIHRFSSTPLTIEKLSGNRDGAITGWAFTNDPIPAESKMSRVAKTYMTPIPGIYQAGQWTYSPSGLPISILTGKVAADQTIKSLKQHH